MLTSESDRRTVKAMEFYEHNYDTLTILLLRSGMRVLLGDKHRCVCRFCGGERPTVSFRSRAHTIPKFLGNKSLFAYYECDTCNQFLVIVSKTTLEVGRCPVERFRAYLVAMEYPR